MIRDQDIIFITTTLKTKWLPYQRSLIKKFFPESDHLIIDGTHNWPYVWFYWMSKLKDKSAKWFILIDEDCFILGKDEILRLIQKMETEDLTLSAVSDAYHHYRGANPVAINSFFMIGNVEHFNSLNFDITKSGVTFSMGKKGWINSLGIIYNESKHRHDFSYPHEIMENGENCEYEQEPYYMILWMLKEQGRRFNYLYPHFDERFKSTNLRISKESPDIAIHMWYARQWNSGMDVHGIPNYLRYQSVEDHIKSLM